MKVLFAPWRSQYTKEEARSKNEDTTEKECVFCQQFHENKDAQYYILKRTKNCIVILNRYPYNAGHLLILPIAHIGKLEKLPKEVRHELMDLVSLSSEIVQSQLGAQGVNIGLNLGKAAGAGIPSHLHFHVLPRWIGDANFMPILGQTKVISFDLDEIYQKLKPHF